MKKWLMPLAVVVTAIAAAAFALAACGNEGDGHVQYEVTLSFNRSVTQADIEEAEAILRAFDDDLDFVIMESFPPTGRALLEADTSDFCTTVEEELEAKSYLDGVSCQPWKESGDAGQDVPVSVDNTEPPQALSVSELLADPVYGRPVDVWGNVSLLGELFCPCFELTSEGETVIVWYDLMVEEDGTERPSVSTEGIGNGDTVVVSGELKRGSTHAAPGELWAESVEKWPGGATSAITPSGTPGLPAEIIFSGTLEGVTVQLAYQPMAWVFATTPEEYREAKAALEERLPSLVPDPCLVRWSAPVLEISLGPDDVQTSGCR